MIVYGYKCPSCNYEFESPFHMGEAPAKARCPICHGPATRQFSVPSVHWHTVGSTKGRINPFRHRDGSCLTEADKTRVPEHYDDE